MLEQMKISCVGTEVKFEVGDFINNCCR